MKISGVNKLPIIMFKGLYFSWTILMKYLYISSQVNFLNFFQVFVEIQPSQEIFT